MTNLDTEKLLSVAEGAGRTAGEVFKKQTGRIVKSFAKDVKINVDFEAHGVILELLKASDIPVLSEEDEIHNFDMNLKWVVDPLDGSINFLRGIPNSAVSIALIQGGEPLLGVVYDFNREEMFSGIVGVGAWLNGKDISVSHVSEKSEAILMTGFPSYTDYSSGALGGYISKIQSFKKVRLIGSAALSLAYVASGRADAYYEKDIKIWDVAAGLALVKSAGGKYSCIEINNEGNCLVSAGNSLITKI